ncbi:hypothetical protein FHS38_006632 [Streptomyces netropsis]|uniref:Uncharacterized protein n=1 Tax=Streptomyces netropsis TaxID=55404 RepID=A0A7W7LI07_STRNE|nr:hypothetical protein [Streptomyces netropsis]
MSGDVGAQQTARGSGREGARRGLRQQPQACQRTEQTVGGLGLRAEIAGEIGCRTLALA